MVTFALQSSVFLPTALLDVSGLAAALTHLLHATLLLLCLAAQVLKPIGRLDARDCILEIV
jgi:hypothetical protein